jgi:PAS domain S-box-containing protein
VSTEVRDLTSMSSFTNIEEDRVAFVLASAEIAWWDWDLKTNNVIWNDYTYPVFGLKPFEITPTFEKFLNYIHPQDLQGVRKKLKDSIRNHEMYQHEFRVVWADGSVHLVVVKGKALYDEKHEPYRMWGTAVEITERRSLENEARQSIECLKSIEKMFSLGIWKCNVEGKFIYASPSFLNFLKTDLESLNNGGWLQLLSPEQNQQWQAALEKKEDWETEICISNPTETKKILTRARTIIDSKGIFQGWVGANMDINEQADLQNSLHKIEDRLSLSLMAAQMATFEFDVNRESVNFTGRWFELFGADAPIPGWSKEAFLSRVHPDDRESVSSEIQYALNGIKDSYSLIYRVIWPDGSIHYLSEHAKMVKDHSGKPELLQGAVIDVTHLKETELRLHEAIHSRDDFLSVAAHELRTPLSTLAIQMQMARRQLEKKFSQFITEENLTKVFETSNRQVSHLVFLVDKLLEVSKIMNGKLSLNRERVRLNQLLTQIVENFRKGNQETTANFILEMDEQIEGEWDRHRLGLVVTSLISNAVKFGESKPILIRTKVENQNLVLTVKDNGTGISELDSRKVFRRFEKNNKLDCKVGLGLGLYITKEIVEAHGGTIKVDSKLGEGSTFTVQIPLNHHEDQLEDPQWPKVHAASNSSQIYDA